MNPWGIYPCARGGLCGAFSGLAQDVWTLLGRNHAVGLQPGEETITDSLLLHLSELHHYANLAQVRVKTHTNRAEGVHGADWDLWIVQEGKAVGFRLQAKVSNVDQQSFDHLHFASGQNQESQADKLIRHAQADGLVPLYVLYQTWTRPYTSAHVALVGREAHGCSLLAPDWVQDNVQVGHGADLSEVVPVEIPWEVMFCWSVSASDVPEALAEWATAVGLADPATPPPMESVPPAVQSLLTGRSIEELERPTAAIEVLPE